MHAPCSQLVYYRAKRTLSFVAMCMRIEARLRRTIIMINIAAVMSVLLFAECSAKLTKQPSNTVAYVGSDAVLTCSTNNTKKPKWSVDTNNNFVYNGDRFVPEKCPRCSIAPPPADRKVDLLIKSVDLSDARRYYCSESEDHASSELMIIESELDCRSNETGYVKESQLFELLCFLKFAGNWIPSISWRRKPEGETPEMTERNTVTEDGFSKTLTSRLVIPARRDVNGTQFTSKVFFDVSNKSSAATATNIPELQKSTWTSDILLVAYGPADVKVVSQFSSSSESTKFTCSAIDINPAPVYRWINATSGKELGEGPELDGCDLTSQPQKDVKCIVKNKASGAEKNGSVEIHHNVWDQMVIKCEERHQEMVVVITVVCIGVVVVIGAFTVVFIILRQPGCSDRSRRNAIPDLVNGHAAPLPAPAAGRQMTPSSRRVAAPPPANTAAAPPALPTAPPQPVAVVTEAQSLRDVNANITNSETPRDTHSNNGGTGVNYIAVVGSNHVSDASDVGSSDDEDDRVDVSEYHMHKDYINISEAYRPVQAERAAAIASAAGIQPPEDDNYNSDGPIYTSVSSTTGSAGAATPRLQVATQEAQYAAIDHSCLPVANVLQTAPQAAASAAASSTNAAVDKK